MIGSANAYHAWFSQYWPKLGPRILAAQSSKEISKAIEKDAVGISASLAPFSQLILKIVRDSNFPRARAKSQIHFLADSLAGQGFVTPRWSREICAEERKRVKHFIIRREYYIECSSGYKGLHWTQPAETVAAMNYLGTCGSKKRVDPERFACLYPEEQIQCKEPDA